ncbi:MAG: aspartate aminotransferase family protein, partial [Pseudomonadota bacterium]
LYQRGQEHGVILRAIPIDSVAFCPPVIVNKADIEEILRRFGRALEDTWRWVNESGLVTAA